MENASIYYAYAYSTIYNTWLLIAFKGKKRDEHITGFKRKCVFFWFNVFCTRVEKYCGDWHKWHTRNNCIHRSNWIYNVSVCVCLAQSLNAHRPLNNIGHGANISNGWIDIIPISLFFFSFCPLIYSNNTAHNDMHEAWHMWNMIIFNNIAMMIMVKTMIIIITYVYIDPSWSGRPKMLYTAR